MQVALLEIAPNTDQDVCEAMAKLIPLLTERQALCEQCSYVHALHMDGISANLLTLPFYSTLKWLVIQI